ncbi:MAG: hypothetical protein IJR47_04680, partial [Clostridia bacterium]|nr:hypothetical protein [Clostridia bacterium]
MKRKVGAIIAIIIAILLVAVMFIPRASANQYATETILDSERGINIRYPKTGNNKLDEKTIKYVNSLIDEHSKYGEGDVLSVDYNCFSSAFTNIIRINSSYEKPNSNPNERNIKAYGKYFAYFKAFSSAPAASQVQELYPGTGTGITIEEIMNLIVAKLIEASKPKPTEKKADSNKKLIALTFDDGPG